MPGDFSTLITENNLRELAGDKSFRRGLGYFQNGAVASLTQRQGRIKAVVEGSVTYKVTLARQGGELVAACDCPMGDQGYFCKHAVAVGLAWLSEQGAETSATENEADVIRRYLESLEPGRLVELLLTQADWDEALRNQLYARAVQQLPEDARVLKQLVQQAFAVRGFVDYRGMRNLLARLYPVVDLLQDLLDGDQAAQAYELADYALGRGLTLYERVDDSDGGLGDVLHQISALHLAACQGARPPGVKLAKRLFQLRLKEHWGLINFYDYAELLDDKALAVYRKAAEKEWGKVPVIKPGDKKAFSSSGHFNITRIMEELAHHDDDLDALIAIKQRDLSDAYQFLKIAQLLDEAGRRQEALQWAEQGLKTFTERPDRRLVEFVTDHYQRAGRHEEALALAWRAFTAWLNLSAYQQLKAVAELAGVAEEWAEKTIQWLQQDYPKQRQSRNNRGSWQPDGNSLLVEILLWEKKVEAALIAAQDGGCSESHWFQLAGALEKQQPAEAARIYRRFLDGIVDQRNNNAYDQAAELMATIRALMHKAKQQKAFTTFLAEVRTRHKAKRNFMQRLDAVL